MKPFIHQLMISIAASLVLPNTVWAGCTPCECGVVMDCFREDFWGTLGQIASLTVIIFIIFVACKFLFRIANKTRSSFYYNTETYITLITIYGILLTPLLILGAGWEIVSNRLFLPIISVTLVYLIFQISYFLQNKIRPKIFLITVFSVLIMFTLLNNKGIKNPKILINHYFPKPYCTNIPEFTDGTSLLGRYRAPHEYDTNGVPTLAFGSGKYLLPESPTGEWCNLDGKGTFWAPRLYGKRINDDYYKGLAEIYHSIPIEDRKFIFRCVDNQDTVPDKYCESAKKCDDKNCEYFSINNDPEF